ncbi:MAG: response regulator [bacterium]|nr:response regulator [bacterium]
MNTTLKNFVVYVVIAGKDKSDHVHLRNAIYRYLPQAIVESLYEPLETRNFFKKNSPSPHLIFLGLDMIKSGGKDLLNLFRDSETLTQVPMVILTESMQRFTRNDLIRFGANDFYSKPYQPDAFDKIVANISTKLGLLVAPKVNRA